MINDWVKIPNYNDTYAVNSEGKIKNLKTQKILKTHKNKLGYVFVRLSLKGLSKKHRVHRLVGVAFIPNPDNKPFINHLDSNPSNNHKSNLAWCTQAENIQHAYTYGFKTPTMNRVGTKTGKGSKYANVYLDKARNRWIANVDFSTSEGNFKRRKFFAVSRFESSEQAEKAAAYAVNLILDSIQDTGRTRNPVILTEEGKYQDVAVTTSTN